MKSLVLLEPGKLELRKKEIPQYGCNEVLIRVISASICHTDFVALEGQHSLVRFPCVLGHEFSGIIAEMGEGVTDLNKGDRVTATSFTFCEKCPACRRGAHNACRRARGIPFGMDGAFQDYISLPSNMVFPFRETLRMEEAALAEPAANGFSAVDRADIAAGETVVVIGPGPIGLLSLQFARLKNPELLIMTGTRKERLDLAKNMGATHTINVREADPYKSIMGITGGYGADVVLFCGGGQDAWEMAESILAPFGRIVVEALPDSYNSKWPVSVAKFTERSIGFLGVSGYNSRQFDSALRLMENNKIDVSSLITHRFPLDEYTQAFSVSENRTGGAIKVLINVGNE